MGVTLDGYVAGAGRGRGLGDLTETRSFSDGTIINVYQPPAPAG
jgi:hypothetical protein